ncbi:MAG: hypothetical protein K9H64_08500 [Bacteroidales bacterium]|nr:hypothetical protein [Bacteroidales bacterium]MCF8455871.1 hypothetical protein [Bacteroidales bacterium]
MKRTHQIIIYLFVLNLISTNVRSQEKIYYDSLWKETKIENAVYYRVIETIEKGKLYLAKDYFMSGALQMEGCYSNIKKELGEGPFVWYYEDSVVRSKANYQNGKYDGVFKRWHPNGQLEMVGKYSNGIPDSLWTWWYKDGTLMSKVNYVDGNRDGVWHINHPNGKKAKEVIVKNGEFDGYFSIWDTTGILITKYESAGEDPFSGVITDNYPDGKIHYRCNYVKGKLSGPWSEYYGNGQVKITGELRRNKAIGKWKYYEEDGKEYHGNNFMSGKKFDSDLHTFVYANFFNY